MAMTESILVAKSRSSPIVLLPGLANRHGLIAGATGTGKTVTLQTRVRGVLGSILGGGRKRR
jgi:Cdc6-like AAA superfamily ATPase